MKLKNKMGVIILLLCIMVFSSTVVHATGFLDNVISQGKNFGQHKDSDNGIGDGIKKFLTDNVIPIIGLIGNLVFAAVTVILGAKYIWSGVDGKSQVKETLPTFITAVIFFYLAGTLTTYALGIGETLGNSTNYNTLAGKIIATVNVIVRYLAFGGVLAVGLKYMFESADGKAKIKDRMVPLVLGLVLVFSASTFVDYIIDVGAAVLN